MRVELHDNLRQPLSLQATRLVVYDLYDNPIAVVVQMEDNRYVAATCANPSFEKILKSLGINKTLVVEHLNVDNLKPLV